MIPKRNVSNTLREHQQKNLKTRHEHVSLILKLGNKILVGSCFKCFSKLLERL